MKDLTLVALVLLVLSCFLIAGCIQQTTQFNGPRATIPLPPGEQNGMVSPDETKATPVPSSPARNREQLVEFVENAVKYAQKNEKEKALSTFSDPKGPFIDGELYVYAYDMGGNTLAHPVNPEKIGVNRLLERDAKGGYFIRDLRDAAMNGSGFVNFSYINPVKNRTIERKLGYVMKVDDTWWLGSGIYQGPLIQNDGETNATGKTAGTPASGDPMEDAVSAVRLNATRQFEGVNKSLWAAAGALSPIGLDDPSVDEVLLTLRSSSPYAINCITIDPSGRIKSVFPPVYKDIKGKSILDQEHIRRLFAFKKPVSSGVIMTVEGVYAVDFAMPVTTPDGKGKGAVTLLLDDQAFWSDLVAGTDPEGKYEVTVLQPDGRIVYDADPVQIGKNSFTDPFFQPYPSLLTLIRNIASQPEGNGTYFFTDVNGTVVKKEAVWKTVSIYGTEWRTIFIRVSDSPSGVKAGVASRSPEAARRVLLSAASNGTELVTEVDRTLMKASGEISFPSPAGVGVLPGLSDLAGKTDLIVNSLIFDQDGTVTAVSQNRYRGSVGSNLMHQQHIQRLFAYGLPTASPVIPLMEGVRGIAVCYPVIDPETKEVAGGVSVALDPAGLFGTMFSEAPGGKDYQVWVMQPDGQVVFDRSRAFTGRMLFTDPFFRRSPDLIDLGRQIAVKKEGTGTYHFVGREGQPEETREVYWSTFSVHGTEYRMVVERVL